MVDINNTDKFRAHALCLALVEAKIAHSREHLNGLKSSSASETKSSAGDKFETSREMMQQEINKAERHLSQLVKQRQQITSISGHMQSATIELGSYVVSNLGSFYISTALGKIKTEQGFFYAISTDSPMAEALEGKAKGDKVSVNGRNVIVKELL